MLKSSKTTPKLVLASLAKKTASTNPNVVLRALDVCDGCVKNGGASFAVELAVRIDIVSSLIGKPEVNVKVKERSLALIQQWAELFKGRHDLLNVGLVYDLLKAQGTHYPGGSAANLWTRNPADRWCLHIVVNNFFRFSTICVIHQLVTIH